MLKLRNPTLQTKRRWVAGGQLEDSGETTSRAGDWQGCGQRLPVMAKQSAVAAKPLCQTPTYQDYNSYCQTKQVSKQGRPLWRLVSITTRSAQETSCNAQLKGRPAHSKHCTKVQRKDWEGTTACWAPWCQKEETEFYSLGCHALSWLYKISKISLYYLTLYF